MNAKMTGQEFAGEKGNLQAFPFSTFINFKGGKKKVIFTMGRSDRNYFNQMIKVSITS